MMPFRFRESSRTRSWSAPGLWLLLLLCPALLAVADEHAALANSKKGGGRVVSVPDIHGDFGRAASILKSMGIMDENQRWVGGSTTLVQTGDLVDRGEDSEKVLKLFSSLAQQAPKQGGQVINLLGNHEMMLLDDDTRYVNPLDKYPEGGGFEAAWGRDGWARKDVLTRFRPLALAGETLFVHAGLHPKLAQEAFGAAEEEDTSSSLAQLEPKQQQEQKLQKLQLKTMAGSLTSFLKKRTWTEDEGPFWTRFFAMSKEEEVCPKLAATLKAAGGARRMVVGHTMQEDHKVNSRCGGQLILADTVISRGYLPVPIDNYERKTKPEEYPGMSALEIDEEGNAFAVYTPEMTRVPLDRKRTNSFRRKATL